MLALNHYPRHVGDYLRDTVDLTMLEDGAYTRLLDQYYSRGGPLPADKAKIYRIARAVSKQERAAVDSVLRQFFVVNGNGWHNKRSDLELQAQSERSASASESAKRRWEKEHANASANAMPTDMQTHSDGNAESMLTSNQKPVTSKAVQEPGAIPPPKPKNSNHVKNLGTRLPNGWFLPDDWKAWAVAYRPDWDEERVVRESLVFRDHWYGKPGKDGRKADWLATWRNWVRRAT